MGARLAARPLPVQLEQTTTFCNFGERLVEVETIGRADVEPSLAAQLAGILLAAGIARCSQRAASSRFPRSHICCCWFERFAPRWCSRLAVQVLTHHGAGTECRS